MKRWIENRRVLAVFSDPAGAKAVLAYLYLYRFCAKSITVISNREYNFYQEFGFDVLPEDRRSYVNWLDGCDVLITGTSYPLNLEISLIYEATKLGIPSISFVDHWINIADRYRKDGKNILSNVIAVVDDHAMKLAKEEGLPIERLCVTGNPYHKYLQSWRPTISKTDLLTSLELSSDKSYILFLPEPLSQFGLKEKYGFDEFDAMNLMMKVKGAMNDKKLSLIVKGHPNQNHKLFREKLRLGNHPDIIYLENMDVNTLAYYANLVVGSFSNALIEAKILGTQVVRPLILLKKNVLDPLASQSSGFVDTYSVNEFIETVLAQSFKNTRT